MVTLIAILAVIILIFGGLGFANWLTDKLYFDRYWSRENSVFVSTLITLIIIWLEVVACYWIYQGLLWYFS